MAQYSYPYTGGPLGSRVLPVAYPKVFSDLSAVYPNLAESNTAASQSVLSKLRGELSPATQQAIQDTAAKFAVQGGMPGSNAIPGTLTGNRNLRDIGRATEDVQSQGVAQFASLLPTVSQTQTVNPELQTAINYQNALSGAAPEPNQAASYARNLFDYYTKKMSGVGSNWKMQQSYTPGQVAWATPYWQDEAGNTSDYFPGWG